MIEARVIADSVNDYGNRLTTFVCTYPRFVLAEVNTHRQLSRNSASSRAIPVQRMIEAVLEHPVIPLHWGKNQKGMQAEQELTPEEQERARGLWLEARDQAVAQVEKLLQLGLHKQVANRLLEAWLWTQSVISATEWENFYGLRTDAAAQPEFQALALAMFKAQQRSRPRHLETGEWHIPMVSPEEVRQLSLGEAVHARYNDVALRVSAGRCAGVSYTLKREKNTEEAMAVTATLIQNGHMSPLEHQAQAWPGIDTACSGNFRGWYQFRKTIPHECRSFDMNHSSTPPREGV